MAKKKEAQTPEQRLQSALVPKEEWPHEIPENWCWTYWGICGIFTAGSGFKKEYQGHKNYPIPFYKVGSLKYSDEKGILYDNDNTINEDIRQELKAAVIPENSLIFAKIGEAIRLNRRSINAIPCCIDNNLMSFYAKTCLPRYVYLWSFGIELYKYANATTVPAIRKSDLEGIPFPLPPSCEQQRIVDRIESLFAKLDEAKEKAQVTLDSFEPRKAAILHKAFTGELTEQWRKEHRLGNQDWKVTTIGSISEVKGGKRVPKGMALTTDNTGHPYIKAGNLKGGTVNDDGMMYVPDDVLPLIKNYTVDAGDVYITNVGACIGDCGIVPAKYHKANLTENAVKITNMKCLGNFLAKYLSSADVQNFIKESIASATLGKLSILNIKKIPLYLPTDDEQVQIVRILDELLAKEQQAKEVAEAVLEQIELTKKSILARAFRGELGTNDPNDENAEKLLLRIFEQEVTE